MRAAGAPLVGGASHVSVLPPKEHVPNVARPPRGRQDRPAAQDGLAMLHTRWQLPVPRFPIPAHRKPLAQSLGNWQGPPSTTVPATWQLRTSPAETT